MLAPWAFAKTPGRHPSMIMGIAHDDDNQMIMSNHFLPQGNYQSDCLLLRLTNYIDPFIIDIKLTPHLDTPC